MNSKRMPNIFLAGIAMAVLFSASMAAQAPPQPGPPPAPRHGPGTIRGTVVDTDGKAMDGVTVAASLQPASTLPGPFTPYTVTAVTFGGGNFSLIGIPLGRYQLCVDNQALSVINPCIWSDNVTTVAVSTVIPKPRLVAERGANITIRVDDAKGFLAKSGAADDILIGGGHGRSPFVAARVSSKDATGKTYTMLVPAGKEMNLTVYSAAYQLQDESGKNLTGVSGLAAASGVVALPAQAASAAPVTGTPTGLKTNAVAAPGASAAKATITIHLVGPAVKGGKQ